jgi:D-serine deaminase-like pyridoxal phosphate-dependent protein
MKLESLNTPAALIDVERMHRNIERMQRRMNTLGVKFRPHVKTTKCERVVRAQVGAGARGITVSTLKEAEQFFASGIRDIVYAVGMAPAKLAQALALRRQGCDLKIVADSVAGAGAIVAFGQASAAYWLMRVRATTTTHTMRSCASPSRSARAAYVPPSAFAQRGCGATSSASDRRRLHWLPNI